MRTSSIRLILLALFAGWTLWAAPPVSAQIPQTIGVDGVNDFDPANLLDADGGDTQTQNWCTDDPEDESPMDIGNVYITNDTNNLYIGFEYDRDCFASPQVNLGIAFSYGLEADGGTTDPFSRKISWIDITRKPDNVFYVVLDGFNYEAFYEWSAGAWVNIGGAIDPGYGNGSDGLGMANDLGFEELSLPLSAFAANGEGGLSAGETLYVELWMTQDGTTKPPLDAAFSDDVQTSTPGSTVFDTGTAVEMTTWGTYVVQDATDNDPPVITNVRKDPVANDQVIVVFNEPVDPTTAGTAVNYAITGGSVTVTAAAVDGVASNIVHLTLAAALPASAGTYRLDVDNVEDLAGNALTGVAGEYDFAVKEVLFRGLFENYLATNGTGTDGFTVEGSRAPLDFNVISDGIADMTQVDAVNEIWENTVQFSWGVGSVGGPQTSTLVVEWKFNHNLTTYESIGNRILTLSVTDPASQLTEHFWDDLDPSQFTDKDIDVVFKVDMSAQGLLPGDTVELGGSVPPLDFAALTPMVDDGTGEDETAGDDIYTLVVTFPAGSLKNVEFKYVFNAAFECDGEGNRSVFLNDELFDTIGGINGPLVLPVQNYDRCFTILGDVEVVFSVDLRNSTYDVPGFTPTVGLAGNVSPLVFDPISSALPMLDDGLGQDAVAGDLIYTTSVVFLDDSSFNLEYKYVVNGEFEGEGLPNRFVTIDDSFDAIGNPQILALDDIHKTVVTGVGDGPAGVRRAEIRAHPNPFNPRTTLHFAVPRDGRVRIAIFDVRGRKIRTLLDAPISAGPHSRVWDGKDDRGAISGSGVYFAQVLVPGEAATTKLVLLK